MSTSTRQPYQSLPTLLALSFRQGVPLHELLRKPPNTSPLARADHQTRISLALPPPAFRQHLALLRRVGQG
jgi:hypothetical protein